MKISNCSCSCGNVRIKGQLIPQGVYPNIPPSERERLRFCKNLFSIQPQSIEIQQFNKVRGRLLNSICADMTCTSCGSTFRFFSGRGFSYFGRLQPLDNNSQASRQNNHKTFPPLKVSQKPTSNQPQAQNLNNNNDKDDNLSGTLPPLFTPLISRHKQKNFPQEIQMKTEIDQIPSQMDYNPSPNTDLFTNIEKLDLDLDNGIDIDKDLDISGRNEEMLFTNNDDIDFELMFSNKADPVVGSYKQHMGAPFDGGIGNISHSDFQPKSYFA